MTTFGGRQKHYIDRTLASLFESDGRHLPINLILGSSDASHVTRYRDVASIVLWNLEAELQARKGQLRHNCNVNAIRALMYGDSDYCLCCEDDIVFEKNWYAELMLTVGEIERADYVLNLGQSSDRSYTGRYAEHKKRYLCGAQAIFYPRKTLRRAVGQYVRDNIRNGLNDFLIGRYAKRRAVLYNTVPVLVKHIGGVSSFES